MRNIHTTSHRVIAYLATLALASISFVSATLPADECIQGSGCIPGKNGGTATFQFTGAFTLNPTTYTGNLTYVDASAGINISSTALWDMGQINFPNERVLSFTLSGGAYSEARIFVSDSGPTTSDTFRIQLLDSASVPVYENFGVLQEQCGAGITLGAICETPPCDLKVTVACAVVSPNSTPSTTGCTVTGNSAEVDFYYTIENVGTVPIALSSLTGSDSFGPLDLTDLGTGFLQPGAEVTMVVRETVTGPFPVVNTVTFTVNGAGGVDCSDMATINVTQRPTEPPPQPDCDDFVTGGGWIVGTPSGAKANFGVHGGIRNGAFWGGLNYIDHGTGMHVKSTATTGYTHVSDVGRRINFSVTIDGVAGTAVVTVHDNGEPGRDDTFEIELSNGYRASGDLGGDRPGGGNIQLHKSKCDKGKENAKTKSNSGKKK